MQDNQLAIQVESLKKQYRLGYIGTKTLAEDIRAWWAKLRHRENPNTIIGRENATNKYFYAVNDVSFQVAKGEALGLLGANGAGKSTLLKLITRITSPTDGAIRYNGRIASMLEVGTGFHDELTGRENIYMNGAILGMTREEVAAREDEIISFSECGEFIDTPLKRYSSGMRIKLGFAVASHLNNEIMIMDEVLAVGDLKFQRKCIKKMREISMNEGRTILYVSHNMTTIRDLCNRCIVLDKGKLIFDGDVEHAIDIYSESMGMSTETRVDLSNRQRPTGHRLFDGSLAIQSVEMLGKTAAVCASDEETTLRIKCHAKRATKNTLFYCVVKYQGDIPVGTMTANEAIDFDTDEHTELDFVMNFAGLAPGRYVLDFHFSAVEKGRIVLNYDVVSQAFSLEVLAPNASCPPPLYEGWNHTSWGSVALAGISLQERRDTASHQNQSKEQSST